MLTIKQKRISQPKRIVSVAKKWRHVFMPLSGTGLNYATIANDKYDCIQPISTGFSPVRLNWNTNIVNANKPFTILTVINLGSATTQGIIAQRNATSWTFCVYDNYLNFYTGSGFLGGVKPVKPAGWVNIIISCDGTDNGYIYLNETAYPVVGFTSIENSTHVTELLSWDNGGYVAADSKLALVALSDQYFTPLDSKSLTNNPWQIFAKKQTPVFYSAGSGSPTTTASGSLPALSLSAPNVISVQTSIASGSLATLTLSAPNVTATTVPTTIVSGSLPALNLSAPNVTSVKTSIASGSLSSVSLSAPTGTASTVASVIASGNIVAININAPTCQPVLSVKGTGYFSPMTLIAPNHVLAPSTTVPEIVNFDTMIQRETSFDGNVIRSVSYTTDINRSVSFNIER